MHSRTAEEAGDLLFGCLAAVLALSPDISAIVEAMQLAAIVKEAWHVFFISASGWAGRYIIRLMIFHYNRKKSGKERNTD